MTSNIQRHPFHLVDSSPWPFSIGIASLATTSGFVLYMHYYVNGFIVFFIGFLSLLFISFNWWKDVVRESTYQGHHTKKVQYGLRSGMLLFILSEIMFFFAFFWAFFSASLAPSEALGCFWPPPGIDVLSAWEIPFLNTVILLLSGATCTWSHNAIVLGNKKESVFSLFLTIILGGFFHRFNYWNI
jgi:heme/copper-type cytochrome/quinol oxidase subunit 3